MGSDWENKFDEFNDICKVIYILIEHQVFLLPILLKLLKINKIFYIIFSYL